jgi:hypothetical protein
MHWNDLYNCNKDKKLLLNITSEAILKKNRFLVNAKIKWEQEVWNLEWMFLQKSQQINLILNTN